MKKKKGTSLVGRLRGRLGSSKFLVFAGIFAIFGVATLLITHAATGDNSIPVYRLYNPNTSEHFYTDSQAEAAATHWSDEDIAFYAWGDGNNGQEPIYRVAGAKHFYTASAAERDAAIKAGARNENIAFYAYATAASGRIPVYRLYNGKTGDHLYTQFTQERDVAIKNDGYSLEGIAFYVSDHSVPKNDNKPIGAVDTNTCSVIAGWTADKDNPTLSNQVDVYIDGVGYLVGATTISRPDVNAAKGVTGNHGFSFNVPAQFRNSQQHTAVVYGINMDSVGKRIGDNVELGRKTWICNPSGQTITQANNYAPIGNVDTNTCDLIAGWTLDDDQSSSSIQARVYIDGAATILATSGSRPDVNAARHVTGNHGYAMIVPASWRDGKLHTAVVYGINVDNYSQMNGNNVELGRKTWACNSANQDVTAQVTAQQAQAQAAATAACRYPGGAPVIVNGHVFNAAECQAFAAYLKGPTPPPSTPPSSGVDARGTGGGLMGYIQTKIQNIYANARDQQTGDCIMWFQEHDGKSITDLSWHWSNFTDHSVSRLTCLNDIVLYAQKDNINHVDFPQAGTQVWKSY